MFNLITIGDALIDTHVQIDDATLECDINHEHCHLCLDYASKIPITGSFQSLGGNGANVACGASKLGLKTVILSSVGNDSNGKLVEEELTKFKVNTSLISIDKTAQTRYSVVLNFRGERTILSYHQKRQYVWPDNIPATDWIYYTGMSEGFEKIQTKLINHLRKHPTIRSAFNPGSYQLKQSLELVQEMIAHTNLLIINLEEAEKILNTTLAKEKTPVALIHKLLALGAEEVVITDASRGAWAGDSDSVWHINSFPVEVKAKTGAGDAFSSGYLAARFNKLSLEEALVWGIANSSSVIVKVGSQNGLLDKAGIKKMINKYSKIKPKAV
ncbi:MAG: hypothetical protein UR53_C0001G0082 [Candidatus Magasanikbacteria bacterium GW2011_GWC2_34_16]|uniref:Carbohydrate kinase PfkB domain-containing protein n=2 Tax=Candidatus Magasanikiibacteriota TaxID=1752731 RepID=A0A0G0HD81_9BACT|nr:MAG: hypothetical protein UR53_C0001G0082 [Candidatus Magasanikbacteria bacterium GW2011_GWC2_34_16]KKQ41108.1 MAG: hypothetical protein US58_C0005G0033 [Candidatus Magasanikbacteria bacterium GW2011_GWA2_37_8]